MDILFDLWMIQVIVCIITNLSGFNDTWKSILKFIVTKGKFWNPDYPGFNLCDLCITWWSCLLYLIITGNVTLMWLAVSLLMAYFTRVTTDLIVKISDTLIKLIEWKFGRK